jgi:signal transduction histidine kinase
MAIANSESRSELAASRERIVLAADVARRRIQRDLHDGAQQLLVSLALELRSVQAGLEIEDAELAGVLTRAVKMADQASRELQESLPRSPSGRTVARWSGTRARGARPPLSDAGPFVARACR